MRKFWGEDIINYSYYPIRDVDMRYGVAYGEDLDNTRAAIMSVLDNHPDILKDPVPFLEVETLNESSVDFLVRPYCEGDNYFSILYSIPEQIKKTLDKAGIEIPFPHQKVILFKGDE